MSSTTTINGVVYTIITGTGPFELLDWTGAGSQTNFMISGFTSVANNALKDQTTITNVHIGNTVTSIGQYAFYGTSNLISVSFESNSQLDTIGDHAFNRATSLTSIAIPDKVTSIGYGVFIYATSLNSVTFGTGSQLTSIGDYAFYETTSLSSIAIPDGVTSIGSDAFYATSLISITFGPGSQLTSIGSNAFREASALTSIAIPDLVTSIGSSAFSNATELASITFGASSQLNTIEDYTFWNATSLTSIIIPDTVTNIGNEAFRYTYNLASITIPDSVNNIGKMAFDNIENYSTVYVIDVSPNVTFEEFKVKFNNSTNRTITYVDLSLSLTAFELNVCDPGADIIARAGLEDKWNSNPNIRCNGGSPASDNSYFYMDHVGNTVGWNSYTSGGQIPYIDITKTWKLRLTCNQGSPIEDDTIIYIIINHDPVAPVTNADSSLALDTNVPNIFSFTTTVSTDTWETHDFEIPDGLLNESNNTILINNTWGYSRISHLSLYQTGYAP